MNTMNFIVWMFPVIFMLHDFEEIIMAEVWLGIVLMMIIIQVLHKSMGYWSKLLHNYSKTQTEE